MNKSVIIIGVVLVCAGLGLWHFRHAQASRSSHATLITPAAEGSKSSTMGETKNQMPGVSDSQDHIVHSASLPSTVAEAKQPDIQDATPDASSPSKIVRAVETPIQQTADSQDSTNVSKNLYRSIQAFEARAKATIPLLSIMTFTPPTGTAKTVTSFSSVSGEKQRDVGQEQLTPDMGGEPSSSGQSQDQLAADQNQQPESEQGQEQPTKEGAVPREGEIWIRIIPQFAAQSKKIMADTARMFREETGYTETISVVLWVGGRPWARQEYPAP